MTRRVHIVVLLVAQSSQTLATPWTVAHQTLLPMGFSRQEYQSGLPFLSPGDLPDTGIEPGSPALQANSLSSEHQGNPGREEISKEGIKGSPSS